MMMTIHLAHMYSYLFQSEHPPVHMMNNVCAGTWKAGIWTEMSTGNRRTDLQAKPPELILVLMSTWMYARTFPSLRFPVKRRKSSLRLNPLFSLIIQKRVSARFTGVQNAFKPLLSVALVAIIGHFRCLYWLIKYYHWPNYAASLHLGEILGWDLLQRPLLHASLPPRKGNNFEPPLKTNPRQVNPPTSPAPPPASTVLLLLSAVLPSLQQHVSIKTTQRENCCFFLHPVH